MVVFVIPVDVFVSSSTLNILFSISLFAIGGISLFAIRDVVWLVSQAIIVDAESVFG